MAEAKIKAIEAQDDIITNLSRLQEGQFFETIEYELATVLHAVRETGKKGTLGISITVEITKGGQNPQVVVKTKIAGKPPKPDDIGNAFFIADDDTLITKHPNQLDVFRS